MRITFIFILVLGFVFGYASDNSKPNIIIYLADDLGWKDVGFNGAKVVKSPNLDKLAKQGMVFEYAFVASPACAPSRAALLTGLMPARNGAEANHTYPKERIGILTKKLQENGYKIYAFGKVAHGKMNNECDWDYYHKQAINLEQNVKTFFNENDVEGPVCLLVGDRRPHVLWTEKYIYDPNFVDLPPYFIDTKETREHRARYYSDVTGFDKTLGEIIEYTGNILGVNTITIMTSDHGGQWPFGKWNLYDDGIRTPLIVKWPNYIEEGTRTHAMVSWVDILPTILDLTGAVIPENLDGKSFAKILKEKKDEFREAIFTTHSGDGVFNVYPIRSVRTEKFKYIRNLLPDCYHTNHSDLLRKDGAGAYWDSWDEMAKKDLKASQIISKYYQRPAEEFYDLENDPDEQNNLINSNLYEKEINKMRKMLDKWMKEQGDQETVFREPYPLEKPKPDKTFIEKLRNQGN